MKSFIHTFVLQQALCYFIIFDAEKYTLLGFQLRKIQLKMQKGFLNSLLCFISYFSASFCKLVDQLKKVFV